MDNVTTTTEIARSAIACKRVLDMHALKEHTWIRSAQVDFNLWCSAIKATSFDKSGMDHRLRNYPDARESICNLLDALKSSVEGAMEIYNGTEANEFKDNLAEDSADDIPELMDENGAEAPAWEGELEDSDSTQETDEAQSSSTTSEKKPDEESESVDDNSSSNCDSISTNHSMLDEYISYVRTILDQLTRISLTIRRAGSKYRFERADKALQETEEIKAFRQHLTAIINSGFPDKDAEFLPATEKMKRVYDDSKFSPVKMKLIRANILRRHRIEYFTKARAPRTRAPVETPKVVQMQQPGRTPAALDSAPPKSIVSSKAKESHQAPPTAPQVHEASVEKAPSVFTAVVTATDIGPNFDTTDLSADKTPSRMTKMTKIGGSQAYPKCPKPQPDGMLICPYCNDKLPDSHANNEQSWKAHVAQDILPYSCIMEECSNDDEMYHKADQLLAHMRAKHSSTKWTCNPCSIHTKQASGSDQSDQKILVFFDNAESWQAHTEKEHGNLGPAPQRDILMELSKRQLIGPLECPLCEREPTEPRTAIDEHILKHLHEFALRALPGDVGPAKEKESTVFQASSSADLLSYTKDGWTANVRNPDDESIKYKTVMKILDSIEPTLKRFEPKLSGQARTGLEICRGIIKRTLIFNNNPHNKRKIPDPSFPNLLEVCHVLSYTDGNPQIRDQPHPPHNITLEMEWDMLYAAINRVIDVNIDGELALEIFLNLFKKYANYPINVPLPSPGPDRVDVEDIAERIDTGLTKETDLTRHSNKYKNNPLPLGEDFRKPTKINVGLVRELSSLPNIILTGRDPDRITNTTVELVNELKNRVEDWSILWVDARTVASIQKSYLQILETLIGTQIRGEFIGTQIRGELGDEIPRHGAKALLNYLSWTYEGLWIMVFDGLEAEGAVYLRLENMFPRSCAGTFMISTTDPTSAQLLGPAEVIQVPEADSSLDTRRDRTYELLLSQVLVSQDGSISKQLVQEFRDVVGAIILLATPLSISALAQLVPNKSPHDIKNRLDSLHAVLSVPSNLNEPVMVLDPSFRDFLLNSATRFRVYEKNSHQSLARQCLCIMGDHLQKNICKLPSYGTRRKEISADTVDKYLPPELKYSCRYWARHLIQSQDPVTELDNAFSFLENHFLHWIEAMSILGITSEAVEMTHILLQAVKQGTNSKTFKFIHDARRFILKNREITDVSPLQIYCSAIVFSPENSRIRQVFLKELPNWIKILPRTDKSWSALLLTLEHHSGPIYSVAFSPDGRLLASSSEDETMCLWDAATGVLQQTLIGHSDRIHSVAFSPDGRLLASGSKDETVCLWDTATGALQQILNRHDGEVNSVAFSPDGRLLASGSKDDTVRLWDTATGALQQILIGHSDTIYSVAFSPDGRLLASGSEDETVCLWDIATGALQQTLVGNSDRIYSVVFSPHGRLLASSSDQTVCLWDTATGAPQQILVCHSGPIYSVAFSPDGRLLASSSEDETVCLWDAATGVLQQTLVGHSDTIQSVAFSPDGRLLASGSLDRKVYLWDIATEDLESQQTLIGHSDTIYLVAFSPDGRLLASSSDQTLCLWDTATGALQQILNRHDGEVNSVAFSPDGRLLASASEDETVCLWDTVTGVLQQTLIGHSDDTFYSVAFSPDGRLLASGSEGGTVCLWDTATGALQLTLEYHRGKGRVRSVAGRVKSVAFSPDGRLLASGSDDYIVCLWDVAAETLQQTLIGHSNTIYSVAFSPDGRLLASSCHDYKVCLWDTATGGLQQVLFSNGGIVTEMEFSQDSQYINTKFGSLKLHSESVNMPGFPEMNPEIYVDWPRLNWVALNGEPVLWLPPEARISCWARKSNILALGHYSGLVSFIGFLV